MLYAFALVTVTAGIHTVMGKNITAEMVRENAVIP